MAFLYLYRQAGELNVSDIFSEQGKGRPKGLPFLFSASSFFNIARDFWDVGS